MAESFYDYLYDDPYANLGGSSSAPLLSDAEIASLRDADLTSNTSGFEAGNRTVGNPQGASWWQGLNAGQLGALLAGLGTTGLGIAGIGQSLFGGDKTATTNVSRSLPPIGVGEQAAGTSLMELLSRGTRMLEEREPQERQLFDRSLHNYDQTYDAIKLMENVLNPAIRDQLPSMLREQGDLLRQGRPDNALLEGQRDAVARLTPQAMGQASSLLDQQRGLTDPSTQYRVDPALLNALNTQALGAAQGNLPALNDTLRGQIGRVYEGRLQDVNRYVDTGLLDALERARSQGFHGGAEVLREGMPGSLVDRTMAEAVRQRGTLAGLQAQDELALAQSLPLLGANLATQGANIGFSGNAQNRALAETLGSMLSQRMAIPSLASGLEGQRVGANATAAGAYTTPISVLTQGGSNLINLNRQLAESLGGMANTQMQQRGQLAGAASGALGTMQSGRLAGAGSSQTTSQPTSLLDAFAPTASLLGGVGGLLGGISRYQNPQGSAAADLMQLLGGGMFRTNPDGTRAVGSNI